MTSPAPSKAGPSGSQPAPARTHGADGASVCPIGAGPEPTPSLRLSRADRRGGSEAMAAEVPSASRGSGIAVRANVMELGTTSQRYGLTPRQAELLAFIRMSVRRAGQAPTYGEMMVALDVASKNPVAKLLQALADKGHIRILPDRPRGIVLAERFEAIAIGDPEPGTPGAYTGPYPIRSHRTCAEWLAAEPDFIPSVHATADNSYTEQDHAQR